MNTNRTSSTLAFLAPLADGHVPKIMVKAAHLAAIAEKYKRMEQALEEIADDGELSPIFIATSALSFDPLA